MFRRQFDHNDIRSVRRPYLDLIGSQIGHDLLRNTIDFILHPFDDMRVHRIDL